MLHDLKLRREALQSGIDKKKMVLEDSSIPGLEMNTFSTLMHIFATI